MDNQNLILFTTHLLHALQCDNYEQREIASLNPNLPPIHLFIFKNYPDQGLTTFVSYGLSAVSHPKWHFGRPELLLSVESEKEIWGRGLATIINRFRGEKMFSNGSTYMFETPLAPESGMTGFAIFKPSFLSQNKCIFQIQDKTVYLTQAYPIYPGEAEIIGERGFEVFWEHEDLEDIYDVKREEVSEM